MKGKDERERGERLLAARQVRDVLPRLLRGHDGEEDALGERVGRIVQLELGIAAESDELQGEEEDERQEGRRKTERDEKGNVHGPGTSP